MPPPPQNLWVRIRIGRSRRPHVFRLAEFVAPLAVRLELVVVVTCCGPCGARPSRDSRRSGSPGLAAAWLHKSTASALAFFRPQILRNSPNAEQLAERDACGAQDRVEQICADDIDVRHEDAAIVTAQRRRPFSTMDNAEAELGQPLRARCATQVKSCSKMQKWTALAFSSRGGACLPAPEKLGFPVSPP